MAFFSTLLIIFLLPAFVSAQDRLRIAYAGGGSTAPVWIIQERGLLKKYNISAEIIQINASPAALQAMVAGDVDLNVTGVTNLVSARLAGIDVVMLMAVMPTFPNQLVALKSFNSVQDLKGKTGGITRFGSSTDFTMRYILKKAGLEPDKDVPLLQMGGQPELAAGIEARRIFAAPMTPPALQKTLKAGARIQIPPKTIGLSFPHVGIVVRKTYLAAHRLIVKKFIAGYSEGVATLQKDKEGSKKAIGKFLHTDDAEVLEASWQFGVDVIERIPNLDPEMFKLVLEDRAQTRPEAKKFKPEQFFDDSVVKELEKEGFFKKIFAR